MLVERWKRQGDDHLYIRAHIRRLFGRTQLSEDGMYMLVSPISCIPFWMKRVSVENNRGKTLSHCAELGKGQ